MRLWFLRVKDQGLNRSEVKRLHVAPILFRAIPASACRLSMDEDEVDQLVEKYYSADSNRTKGHFKGSLRRFLSDATVGDLVAVRVNRDETLYGAFLPGKIAGVAGHPGIKGRPVRWLDTTEVKTLLKNALPKSVLRYRGTICLWSDRIDLPEPAEIESEGLVPSAKDESSMTIKFIRVGADAGAGGRLSRLFPGGYYHFIPIPKHNDPEFCRFTYGSGCGVIRDFSLLHLRKGDVLVFYAGFRAEAGHKSVPAGADRVGIFAYYVVKEAFLLDYDAQSKSHKPGVALNFSDLPRKAKLMNGKFQLSPEFKRSASRATLDLVLDNYGYYNPHIDENGSGRAILICAAKSKSRLLAKVEFLASLKEGSYILGPAASKKWGLKPKADLTRCSLRTVDPAKAKAVFERVKALP